MVRCFLAYGPKVEGDITIKGTAKRQLAQACAILVNFWHTLSTPLLRPVHGTAGLPVSLCGLSVSRLCRNARPYKAWVYGLIKESSLSQSSLWNSLAARWLMTRGPTAQLSTFMIQDRLSHAQPSARLIQYPSIRYQ